MSVGQRANTAYTKVGVAKRRHGRRWAHGSAHYAAAQWQPDPESAGMGYVEAPLILGRASLWVTSDQGGDLDTTYNDLSLLTDKRHYNPGDTARVLLNSSHIGQTVLLTIEGDKIQRVDDGSHPNPQHGCPCSHPRRLRPECLSGRLLRAKQAFRPKRNHPPRRRCRRVSVKVVVTADREEEKKRKKKRRLKPHPQSAIGNRQSAIPTLFPDMLRATKSPTPFK